MKKLRNPSQTVAGPGYRCRGGLTHSFLSPAGHHPALPGLQGQGCCRSRSRWMVPHSWATRCPGRGFFLSNSFLSPAPGSGKLTGIQVTLTQEPAEGYMGTLRGQPKKLHRRAESPKLQT